MEQIIKNSHWRYIRSGLLSGALSALLFTYLHELIISDIWFSVIPMVIAGGFCGACLGWSYSLLFAKKTILNWLTYNLIYLSMFGLLGAFSVIIFEPITTVAAVIASNQPPDELFAEALPMTLLFLLIITVALSALYGKNWQHYFAIFITSTALIILLGLNVSVIGLVALPVSSLNLIAELFLLIFVLDFVLAGIFIWLEQKVFISEMLVVQMIRKEPPPDQID